MLKISADLKTSKNKMEKSSSNKTKAENGVDFSMRQQSELNYSFLTDLH